METVVITGASRGIGLAVAKKFLKEGYFVIGTSTSGEIPIESKSILKIPLNLSANFSIESAVQEIEKSGKKIDILINNAGGLFDLGEEKVNVSKLRSTLEVNLIGPIDFTERLISLINKDGHVLNISSKAGSLSLASDTDYPSYRISKTALNMYTKTLSLRLKKDNIIVSSISPGWVKTDMGGEEAEIMPEEAAEDIFDLAIKKPESGQFWYKGERIEW